MNVKMRDNHENNVNFFNEEYFDIIDNEHKAYWLGFIYADGYVIPPIKHHHGKLGILLHQRDEEILQKFKEDLKFRGNINYYKQRTSYSLFSTPCARIVLTSNRIYNSLVEKGVVCNKSLVLNFPSEQQVPSHLLRHFIRGYLDGDGSITHGSLQKTGNRDYTIKFCGTKEFLNGIQNFLNIKLALYRKPEHKKQNKNTFCLTIGGNLQVKKILKSIYKDATIYLERKYIQVKEIIGA